MYDFATTDLSAVYFDMLKDRLYTSATRSHARRSGQTALYRIHYALTRLVAPLLAFTAEEVWGYTAKPAGAPDSVHMALFPEPEEVASALDADTLGKWDRLMEVRDVVLKALEEARQAKFIGAPLEARVRLEAGDDLYPLLSQYAAELPSLFIVSQVAVERAGALRATVERADGQKCERCWKYSTQVGSTRNFRRCATPARRRSGKCANEYPGAIGSDHRRGGAAGSHHQVDHPDARFGVRYDPGDSGIFQYRPHGKSGRGVRGALRFELSVAAIAADRSLAGGDGDHRRNAVAHAGMHP